MVEHSFGGPWTERKLKCLRDYLNGYRTIFTGNPRARYFRTWYVDAFAGTGSRSAAAPDAPLLDSYTDTEAKEYQDGSVRIALGLSSPFDQYLFIEKSRKRAGELRRVITTDYAPLDDRCDIRTGEANAEIRKWCAERDWSKERAVVFLDPYGMQVEWETVKTRTSNGKHSVHPPPAFHRLRRWNLGRLRPKRCPLALASARNCPPPSARYEPTGQPP